jgi:hypothetical protein
VQPVGQNLSSMITGATLSLTAQGMSAATVGDLVQVPADSRADFSVRPGVDVARFVRTSSFGAQLGLANLQPGQYVFSVRAELSIEVEGV